MKKYFLGEVPKPDWLPEDEETKKKIQRLIAKANKSSKEDLSIDYKYVYDSDINEEKQ